jgi:hypothetical protein
LKYEPTQDHNGLAFKRKLLTPADEMSKYLNLAL